MNTFEIIKTRKSVRTFDDRPLTKEDRDALARYAESIRNLYDIPVNFLFLDAKEHGLSTPVIRGEHLYVAAKIAKVPHLEEAYGYSFEKLILYAWSRGIGTTWIGGTMNRALFEKEAGTQAEEYMPCVSPLGYPAYETSAVERKIRTSVHADERLAPEDLFFEKDFSTPLHADAVSEALEAVRWYPSAANVQPCRIIKDGNAYHFYEKHTKRLRAHAVWDIQRIDMGIALCHFMGMTDGKLSIANPEIAAKDDTEYIATVTISEG